jgi:hypothetical protein
MKRNVWMAAASATLAFAVTGCGGGGGDSHVGSIPPPPPPPPPPTSAEVTIFPSPSSQEFAAIGIGTPIRIRYDSRSDLYEVKAGPLDWAQLKDDPQFEPLPGNPNTNFIFTPAGSGTGFFLIRAHYSYAEPSVKYQYSNLAAWGVSGGGGITAFGIATPTTGMPLAGSATYNGIIEGVSSEAADFGDWGVGQGGISGSINLAFNFGSGTLAGSISPRLDLATAYVLPTLAFKDTVYSASSTNFSGAFDTNVAGINAFSGLFTGPAANELIGKFAFPYLSPVNGTAAQATGAFIGKQQ